MSERGDFELLSDIKEAARRIEIYIKRTSYKKFLKDIKIQDAVTRNLEIIGEAAKNISDDLKDEYSLIPWKRISGTRDRLIHNYFGVNYDIVWVIVKKELPKLATQIKKINKNEKFKK